MTIAKLIWIITLAFPLISAGWSYQPNRVVEYTTTCTKDSMDIMLSLDSSFKGIVFAKDYPDACQTNGTSDSVVLLTLPTRGCGVRSDPNFDMGDPTSRLLTVKIIVQMDARLRQAADVEVFVRCKLQDAHAQLWDESQLHYRNTVIPNKRTGRTERLPQLPASATTSAWLELYGGTGSDYAEVGRNATMRVRVRTNDQILNSRVGGARVADCYASDGAPGEITQLLLDRRGCPIDPLILPGLSSEDPQDENEERDVTWSFVTNFAAFKFPDRERVTIRCDVHLCERECRKLDCNTDDFPEIDYVDKIEVYNSLHVEAPEIEDDKDSRDIDITVMPQKIRQDPVPMITKSQKRKPQAGTLCLSPPKLALAFCVMGLIFLVAIIVALCSWFMRSRARNQTQRRYSNVYTCSRSGLSLGGSSTKLLVNTSDGSWPYGRVF